jgi:hypothetical protein
LLSSEVTIDTRLSLSDDGNDLPIYIYIVSVNRFISDTLPGESSIVVMIMAHLESTPNGYYGLSCPRISVLTIVCDKGGRL